MDGMRVTIDGMMVPKGITGVITKRDIPMLRRQMGLGIYPMIYLREGLIRIAILS